MGWKKATKKQPTKSTQTWLVLRANQRHYRRSSFQLCSHSAVISLTVYARPRLASPFFYLKKRFRVFSVPRTTSRARKRTFKFVFFVGAAECNVPAWFFPWNGHFLDAQVLQTPRARPFLRRGSQRFFFVGLDRSNKSMGIDRRIADWPSTSPSNESTWADVVTVV